MCPMLDRYWKDGVATGEARGMAKGLAQGEANGFAQGEARGEANGLVKGRIDTLIATIKTLMNKLNLDLIQAMDMIDVSEDDRPVISEYFK